MDFSHFSRPTWLFFDLDDTLWNFRHNSLLSLRHVFSCFDIINRRFASFGAFVDCYHSHNSVLWTRFADGDVTAGFLKTERWRLTLFPDSDPASPPGECLAIDREYLSCLASCPGVENGAAEVLHRLSRDHMIGVISNGFADTQYRKLHNSGLWKYVCRMVLSAETGITKPDRRIFSHAVSATGASGIPIMIGDNPMTDVSGALSAGWKAIWYNPQGLPSPFSDTFMKERDIDPSLFLGIARSLDQAEEIIRKE